MAKNNSCSLLNYIATIAIILLLTSCGGSGGGSGNETNISLTSIPSAPTDLIAATSSSTNIDLSWTDTSSDETSFRIERSISSTTGFTSVGSVSADVISYTDSFELSALTTYYYRVIATNDVGDSEPSTTANATTWALPTTTPTAPDNLNATATSSISIDLNWTDTSSDETGFKIERSTSPTTGFTAVATVAADVISYTDSFVLSASTTYYYRVIATNDVGDSEPSATANTTTLAPPVTTPSAPTSLSATGFSSSSINLSWTDTSNNETGFKIERSLISNGGFIQIVIVGAGVTTYTNSTLEGSTTYYYRVAATNSAGNSAFSNTENATTQVDTATTAPVLTLSSNVNGDIALEWTYSGWGGLVSTADGYELEESTTSASSGFSNILDTRFLGDRANPKTYSITRSAGIYYYRARAYDSSVYSTYSNVLAVVVASSPTSQIFYPDLANGISYISNIPSQANTSFTNAVAAGCDWIYGIYADDVACYASFMWFNIDSVISDKTINSATLILTPDVLPASYDTTYELKANASAWDGSVTWNYVMNNMLYYIGSSVLIAQPTSSSPVSIDVTAIVQNWADGSWNNYGFQIFDSNLSSGPGTAAIRTTWFVSNAATNGTFRPKLEVNYQ